MSENYSAWTGDEEADVSAMAVSRGPGGFLPARSVRMIAQEDRVERMEARRAEREREERAEARHNQAVAAFMAAAELRGEPVSPVDVMTGAALPTISERLAQVFAEQEARDAVADRWRPDGRKPDEVMFTDLMPEPAPASRSAAKLELGNRLRHWRDRVDARRRADELDGAYGAPAVRSAGPDAARLRYEAACREIGSPADADPHGRCRHGYIRSSCSACRGEAVR